QHYGTRVEATSLDEVNAAAAALVGNRPLTWVVAGDLEKIETAIRTLDLGEVRIIDSEGKVLR
ncbi:MAG: hypothetical protein ABW106_11180, partial [Steroidobacteraceae bacterium]